MTWGGEVVGPLRLACSLFVAFSTWGLSPLSGFAAFHMSVVPSGERGAF